MKATLLKLIDDVAPAGMAITTSVHGGTRFPETVFIAERDNVAAHTERLSRTTLIYGPQAPNVGMHI